MTRTRFSRLGTAVLTTLALPLVACIDDNNQTATPSSESTVSTDQPLPPSHSADGTLTLGLLVPESDPNASFGTQLIPIVEAVVRIMNSFGGFNNWPLTLVVRDEGPTPESARRSAEQLVNDDGVDMVIGPFSAITAPVVLPTFLNGGIGVCSPSVSSVMLDALDDADLFLRTGVQDATIVSSMVELAVQSGSEIVSVAYPDDPYGRALVRLLRSALRSRDITITSDVSYLPASQDFGSVASALAGDAAPVELILANPTTGPGILNAVAAVSQDSVIITNDLVPSATVEFPTSLSEDLRSRVFGFAPDVTTGGDELLNVIRVTDPEFPETINELPPFAVNTVDCLMLTWLSALDANSDSAEKFKGSFLRVANEGSTCLWVADCKAAVDEKVNFNYEGISGLNLDAEGTSEARSLLLFQFDSDGLAQVTQGVPSVTITG